MRKVPSALASFFGFFPQAVLAGGVLNILLAGSIFPLHSSVSPSSISYSYPSASLTSPSATCSGSGGIPPYSFGWSFASGGSGITINSPSSSSTSFTVSGAVVNTTYSGTVQCLVTDHRSISAPYSDVALSMTRIPLLPPSVGTASLTSAQIPDGSYTLNGFATAAGNPAGSGAFGSLSFATDYNGYTVEGIYWFSGSSGRLYLSIAQPSSNATYITALEIGANTFLESAALAYSYTSGIGTWEWSRATNPLAPTGVYNVLYY